VSASRIDRTASVGTSENDGVFTEQATKELTMGDGGGGGGGGAVDV